jgi:hypothetical protein
MRLTRWDTIRPVPAAKLLCPVLQHGSVRATPVGLAAEQSLPRDAPAAQRGDDLGKEICGYALMTFDRRMYPVRL